jgi:hypothetical protein
LTVDKKPPRYKTGRPQDGSKIVFGTLANVYARWICR